MPIREGHVTSPEQFEGAAPRDPNEQVDIVDSYGDLHTVTRAGLNQALIRGFRVATDDEVAGFNEAAEYDNPGLAFAARTAGSATFGATDLAISEMGYGEELEKYRRYNPKASMAGEIAGYLSPSRWTPAGMALSLGTKFSARMIAKFGERFATKLVAQVARGAAGGAAVGYSQHLTEEAMHPDGNIELIGEQAFTRALTGAGMGMAAGAVFAGVGGLFGAAGKAAKEAKGSLSERLRLATDGSGEVTESAWSELLQSTFGRVISWVNPEAREALRFFDPFRKVPMAIPSAIGKKGVAGADDVAGVIGGTKLSVTKKFTGPEALAMLKNIDSNVIEYGKASKISFDKLFRLLDELPAKVKGENLKKIYEKHIDGSLFQGLRGQGTVNAAGALEELSTDLKRLASMTDMPISATDKIRAVSRELGEFVRREVVPVSRPKGAIRDALGRFGRAQDAFITKPSKLDLLISRSSGSPLGADLMSHHTKWREELKGLLVKLEKGAEGDMGAAAASRVKSILEGQDRFLSDFYTWGKAGEFYATINRTKFDSMVSAGFNFRRAFATKESIAAGSRDVLDEAAWIKHLRKGINDPQDEKLQHMLDFMGHPVDEGFSGGILQYLDDVEKFATPGVIPFLKSDFAAIRAAHGEAAKSMMSAYTETAMESFAGTLTAWKLPVSPFIRRYKGIPVMQGMAIGGMIGGVPGLAAGAVVDATTNPLGLMKLIAKGKTAYEESSGILGKGLKSMSDTATKIKGKAPGQVDLTRRFAQVMGKEIHDLTFPKKGDSYPEVKEKLDSMDDEEFESGIRDQFDASTPDTAVAAEETGRRYLEYLRSRMPISGVGQGPLSRTAMTSRSEITKFMNDFDAVNAPIDVALKAIGDGTIKGFQVRALKIVYPQWYREMRAKLWEELISIEAEGKKLPYRKRIALSTFLDMKSDNTMDKLYVTTMAQFYSMEGVKGNPQQQVTSGKKSRRKKDPELEGFFESGSESTERGEGR